MNIPFYYFKSNLTSLIATKQQIHINDKKLYYLKSADYEILQIYTFPTDSNKIRPGGGGGQLLRY